MPRAGSNLAFGWHSDQGELVITLATLSYWNHEITRWEFSRAEVFFLPEQGSRIVDGTAVLLKYHYDLITLYEYWSKCVLVNDYRIYKKMAEKVVTVGELLKTLSPGILRFISPIFCFSSSYFWFQSCLYSSIYLCYAKCVQQLFMNGHGG